MRFQQNKTHVGFKYILIKNMCVYVYVWNTSQIQGAWGRTPPPPPLDRQKGVKRRTHADTHSWMLWLQAILLHLCLKSYGILKKLARAIFLRSAAILKVSVEPNCMVFEINHRFENAVTPEIMGTVAPYSASAGRSLSFELKTFGKR